MLIFLTVLERATIQTVLDQPTQLTATDIALFRSHLDALFKRSVATREKKKRLTGVPLDNGLLECFAALSADCRDEELEDMIYFILDLYQFHGLPVAIAEVDIDHLVVELRMILREYHAKTDDKIDQAEDLHTFLILDKNIQGIPWESIPVLRGKSVSRIPSIDFLLDRLDLANSRRPSLAEADRWPITPSQTIVDPRRTFYVLNPSGDLKGTEARFVNWLTSMRAVT